MVCRYLSRAGLFGEGPSRAGVSEAPGAMVPESRSSVWGDAARRSCFLGDLIGESMIIFVGVSVFHVGGNGKDVVRGTPLLCLLVN